MNLTQAILAASAVIQLVWAVWVITSVKDGRKAALLALGSAVALALCVVARHINPAWWR